MIKILIALGCTLLAFTSCMKAPELKPDFGPEVTDEHFSSLVQPEPPSFNTVQPNEYAYATQETWVDGRPFAINKRWATTITTKVEQATQYVVGVTHEQREYVAGEEKISTRKTDIAVAKQLSAPTKASATRSDYPTPDSAQKALADPKVQQKLAMARQKLAQAQLQPTNGTSFSVSPISLFAKASLRAFSVAQRSTIHNLSFTKGIFPVPEFVSKRANCGGLSAEVCKTGVKAFYLTYDQVDWNENGGQKYTMSRVYSSEVPFFASTLNPLILTSEIRYFYPGVLQACVRTELSYNGVPLQLTQCDEIKDFTFGTP